MSMLSCPKCGFSLRPRAHYLTMEICPRCVARKRIAVDLVRVFDPFAARAPGVSQRPVRSSHEVERGVGEATRGSDERADSARRHVSTDPW